MPKAGSTTNSHHDLGNPAIGRRGILGGVLASASIPAVAAKGMAMTATPCAAWHEAHQRARALWSEVKRRREALTARIGPRGVTVGTFTLATGIVVPIHAGSPNELRKIWRRLPDVVREQRPIMMAACMRACADWDAIAEQDGLVHLQRQAMAATDRAKALLRAV